MRQASLREQLCISDLLHRNRKQVFLFCYLFFNWLLDFWRHIFDIFQRRIVGRFWFLFLVLKYEDQKTLAVDREKADFTKRKAKKV